MKLIIDVPNEVLKSRHYCQYFGAWSTKLTETIENGIPYEERTQGDLISREALKEHKFLTPQVKVIGGRHSGKLKEQIIQTYQKGWNDCIDAIIENAPAIKTDDKYLEKRDADAYESGYLQGHIDGYLKAEKDYAPNKGEWIQIKTAYNEIRFRCNQCNYYINMADEKNFCSHCGADMRKGGQADEN